MPETKPDEVFAVPAVATEAAPVDVSPEAIAAAEKERAEAEARVAELHASRARALEAAVNDRIDDAVALSASAIDEVSDLPPEGMLTTLLLVMSSTGVAPVVAAARIREQARALASDPTGLKDALRLLITGTYPPKS